MQYITSKVIKKHNKTEKIYCNIGDKLKLISDHLGVLIVETKSGYRFSLKVAKSKLKRNRRYYLHSILKGVMGFKPWQRVLYKPYNSEVELSDKQRYAMNELIHEYGYSVQTEIV